MNINKFEDFRSINESSPDYELLNEIEETEAYTQLSAKFKEAIDTFMDEIKVEIGFEEGSKDEDRAVSLAIQSAVDAHYGL